MSQRRRVTLANHQSSSNSRRLESGAREPWYRRRVWLALPLAITAVSPRTDARSSNGHWNSGRNNGSRSIARIRTFISRRNGGSVRLFRAWSRIHCKLTQLSPMKSQSADAMSSNMIRTRLFPALFVALFLASCHEDGPAIPHGVALTADAQCATCHRAHDTGCVECHAVRESWLPTTGSTTNTGTGSAPWVPHKTPRTTDSSCAECHSAGSWKAPVTPHPTQAGCVSCHGENS